MTIGIRVCMLTELVLRTYQTAFIISIVVGLGVGETLFGRYNVQAHIY